MNDYCIKIRLLSPIGTPWQSDTVFGHLAWQVARGRGGMTIDQFLAPFRDGRPPFVLSDAFPGDLLPRPFLPIPTTPSATDSQNNDAKKQNTDARKQYSDAKKRQKTLFITRQDFAAIRSGQLSQWQPTDNPWITVEFLHAAINRLTGTTTGPEGEREQGNLFATHLTAISGGDIISLYLRAEDPWGTWVPEMLADMKPLGFGRDRSTGAGAYEVVDADPFDGFSDLPDANAFISLSSYCPARSDPTRGRWRVRLKYGKLGENAGGGNPFKRPLIQFEPGAVFFTGGPPRPFYGRAVTHIAPGMPEAIQCCYTLAVPCRLPDELVEAMSQ